MHVVDRNKPTGIEHEILQNVDPGNLEQNDSFSLFQNSVEIEQEPVVPVRRQCEKSVNID